MVERLIQKGVCVPAPGAVVVQGIDPDRIEPGCTLMPGTVLRGSKTALGRGTVVGEGGGALVEDAQIGRDVTLMQGVYRDCTVLDRVVVRNGAEIRGGSLLEEASELGHTVGVKQTILFPQVILGSIINFCDVLVAGGTSRKHHSEVGSCTALYNFTPQGDKFASMFGDVVHGVFLDQEPLFIGGQTQIVSPVCVGYGSVIAAGSKLSQNVSDQQLYSGAVQGCSKPFLASAIYRPDQKVANARAYIEQLVYLEQWYRRVRLAVAQDAFERLLYTSALAQIQAGVNERLKRLSAFEEKVRVSLGFHSAQGHTREIASHRAALSLLQAPLPTVETIREVWNVASIVSQLRAFRAQGASYIEAVRGLSHEHRYVC